MPPLSGRSILRHVSRLLLLFVFVPYVAACALVYLFQDSLLYFADKRAPSDFAIKQSGWSAWKDKTGEVRGYIRHPNQTALGTVVVFHGNAGSAFDRQHFGDALLPLGYRVILAEYPAYGERSGSLGETELVSDAKITLKLASDEFPGPLFVWGESLGAGVAAAATRDSPVPITGLALLTPWDTLANVARHHYGYLPVRWLLRDRYDSGANLNAFKGHLAVMVAAEDRTIPAPLGIRLFEQHPGPKQLWRFTNADHNAWPADPDLPWWREVMKFLHSPDRKKVASNKTELRPGL